MCWRVACARPETVCASPGSLSRPKAVSNSGPSATTALGIAGFVIAMDEHDSATALDVFDRALTLSNSNIFALCCGALILAFLGKRDLATERAERALRLSPFDSLNYLAYNALAVSRL